MKRLLVLGAGTAGTMVVNKLSRELDPNEWKITIVDQTETHHYQPGYLFIPFGIYGRNDVLKPRRDYIPPGVEMILSEIEVIEPEQNRVRIDEGQPLPELRLPGHRHRHPTAFRGSAGADRP